MDDIRNQLSHVHTYLCHDGTNQLTLWQGEIRVVVVCLLPTTVMPRPTPAWGTILLDESPVNRGPDDLARGDGHSVELTEACNQSWKPHDAVGLLRAHWVSCGRDPCKQ